MKEKIQAIKGMNDILPPDSTQWISLEKTVHKLMARYAYRLIRTPVLEPTALFVRGLGEVTDIVEKEMYAFEDALNGQAICLRPEGTAGVVRATIEHSLTRDGGKRFYYLGPMFRHERPQRGRYRQFHHIGAEALGFSGPEMDAELMLVANALWKDLGLQAADVRLEINCLGQPPERLAHRSALIAYFEQHASSLDEDAQRRLHTNPLRILDSKNPSMQAIIEGAPRLMDYLGQDSRDHFEQVQAILEGQGLKPIFNPRLVRGMDYYNLTVFEWITDRLGAQGTICGGGRYDGLVEQMGGKPTPAVGFGIGIERVLDLLQELKIQAPVLPLDFYAIIPDALASAAPSTLRVIEALRQRDFSVQMNAGGGSIKTQFKRADQSGARYALIFGEEEWSQSQVAIKSLREEGAVQGTYAIDEVDTWAIN